MYDIFQNDDDLADLTANTRQTAHEYVREVLRRSILNGDLTGGARLVQAELAATLDVSTTPVREALRDLASEGLVRFDPHRGAVVTELDGQDLQDIYEIRRVLEPEAMRQSAPHVTEALLTQLKKLHQKMIDDPHSASFVDLNRIFHLAIYEAGTSSRMLSIIRSLEDAAVMYIGAALKNVSGLREAAINDHAEILAALEAGDTDAAVEAITHHLRLPIKAVEELTSGDQTD
ncbi:MAG: GntR family transcriptional regulator [Acidimicrobiia bacterium]|nr:GntR family transcriptional regulator [Acidimicrobiia bacterium]